MNNEQPLQGPGPINNAPVNNAPLNSAPQVNTAYEQRNPLHFAIMAIVCVLSSGLFLYTGWGMFIFIPMAFVFSLIYIGVFAVALRKEYNPPAVYAAMFTLVLSYVSMVLTGGVVGDDPGVGYLIPGTFGVPSESFRELYGKISSITSTFLFISIIYHIVLIKLHVRRVFFLAAPLFAAILIAVPIFAVVRDLPELRAKAEQQRQARIEKFINASNIDALAYDQQKVDNNTFTRRTYSIFTAPEPNSTAVAIGEKCSYAASILKTGYDLYCLDGVFTGANKLPVTVTESAGFTLSNSNKTFKKGDIVVIVADLNKPSIIRVNANGNPAKDSAYRQYPYVYSGIVEVMKTAKGEVHEQSVVQTAVEDRNRTLMILYPINVNGIKKIDLTLAFFDTPKTVPITLREVSVLVSRTPTPDPEWLKEWSTKPNPFLTLTK